MNYDKMTPQQAVELLCRMIEIPSQSGKEQEVAELLTEYVRALGFEPKRSGNNLWIVSPDYSEEKPTMLFDAHIPPQVGLMTHINQPLSMANSMVWVVTIRAAV